MTASERLAFAFVAEHPEEAARVLERDDPADAAAVIAEVAPPVGAELYRAMGPAPAASCAAALSDDALVAIVAELPLDTAAAALRDVPPARRDALLGRLDDDRRDRLRALLAYPDDTAGALADPLVLALTEDITVAEAQRQLRTARGHLFDSLYLVTRDRTLVGTLSIPELMSARPRQTLASLAERHLVRLDAQAGVATVAAHPAWHDHDALPVVDGAGRLIGAIRHQTIRRMAQEPGRPMMATIVGLSELYWAGLAGMLASLAPGGAARAQEDADVS